MKLNKDRLDLIKACVIGILSYDAHALPVNVAAEAVDIADKVLLRIKELEEKSKS